MLRISQTTRAGLAAMIVAFFALSNCLTVGHDSAMKSEFQIKSETHQLHPRPIEVTHEIKDNNIKGEASGMIIWIPFVFDMMVQGVDAVGKVGRIVLTVPQKLLGSIPYVGRSMEEGIGSGANYVGNLGPLIRNLSIIGLANEAQSKAVYDNDIDGFYRTNVHAEVKLKWIIFKQTNVVVTGKPIYYKNLGPISDARLAKIANMSAAAECTTCNDIKK